MVKLTWADHLRMEANKRKTSIETDLKSVDFYDTDILEKTSANIIPEADNKKLKDEKGDEEHKYDCEFHEQFFS